MNKKVILALAVTMVINTLIPLLLLQIGVTAATSTLTSSSITTQENDDCTTTISTDITTNPSLVAALQGNENAAILAQGLLEGKGVDLKGLTFSRTMVAGIMGNFYIESGIAFARAEKKDGNHGQMDHMSNDEADTWSKGGARGLGIAQWTWNPGRAGDLIALARAQNKNWYDHDIQMQYLIDELSSKYRTSTYEPLKAAKTVEETTSIWLTKYEGINNTTLRARQAAAKSALDVLDSQNIGASQAAYFGNGGVTDLVWRQPQSKVWKAENCQLGHSEESAAVTGSVAGAPTINGDYSWMCSTSQRVCKSGDAGVFYPHLEYGYQCVWYAWNRLAMLHGAEGWTWVMGNGGEIANNVKGKPGWTVSDTPQPGDGASGTTKPFAANTHVAVVEEVQPDPSGWKVHLSEGNFCSSGTDGCWNGYSGSRWLTKTQMGGIQFFRHSAWK